MAFYGDWSSHVFLTNILKYRLERQLRFCLLVPRKVKPALPVKQVMVLS